MANQPKQPEAPPTPDGTSPNTGEHGIPDGAKDEEATGLPTSDRHHTETTPKQD